MVSRTHLSYIILRGNLQILLGMGNPCRNWHQMKEPHFRCLAATESRMFWWPFQSDQSVDNGHWAGAMGSWKMIQSDRSVDDGHKAQTMDSWNIISYLPLSKTNLWMLISLNQAPSTCNMIWGCMGIAVPNSSTTGPLSQSPPHGSAGFCAKRSGCIFETASWSTSPHLVHRTRCWVNCLNLVLLVW